MTISFSNQLVAEMYQPFWAAWQAGEFLTDASAVAVPTAIAGWLGCISPVVSARAVAGICKVGAQCSTTSPDTLADVASHHAPPVVNVRLADPLRGLAGTLCRARASEAQGLRYAGLRPSMGVNLRPSMVVNRSRASLVHAFHEPVQSLHPRWRCVVHARESAASRSSSRAATSARSPGDVRDERRFDAEPRAGSLTPGYGT